MGSCTDMGEALARPDDVDLPVELMPARPPARPPAPLLAELVAAASCCNAARFWGFIADIAVKNTTNTSQKNNFTIHWFNVRRFIEKAT